MDYKEWRHLKNRSENGKPTDVGNRKMARRLAKQKMKVAGFRKINKQLAKKDQGGAKLWVAVLNDKRIPLKKLEKPKRKKENAEG